MNVIANIESRLGRQLRDFQRESLEHLIAGENVIVSAPTGSGKTEIFLAASQALRQDGVTLIVSPLVALVRDQVRRYENRGFRHVSMHGQIKDKERRLAYDSIESNQTDIVITTVESLQGNEVLKKVLKKSGVALLVIDEAHVFEDWAYSFRPGYRRLGSMCRQLNVGQCMLASATLTAAGVVEAATSLGRWHWKMVNVPPARQNLMYLPVAMTNKPKQIRTFMQDPAYPGPGIVYFQTVMRLEQVAEQITRTTGIRPLVYHGQMSDGVKNQAQDDWMKSKDAWIMATNAFGMGIDRSDVRSIAHAEMPPSIMDYAQESGRAGRDGQVSHCWLNSADGGSSAEFLALGGYPSEGHLRELFEFFLKRCGGTDIWKSISMAETAKHLGWDGHQADAKVRTCRGWLSGSGLIVSRRARREYTINVPPDAEHNVSAKEAELIEAVLRAGKVEFDPSSGDRIAIARKDDLAKSCEKLYKDWQGKLRNMGKQKKLGYHPPDKAGQVKVIKSSWEFDGEKLRQASWRARRRLEAMRDFNRLPAADRPAALSEAISLNDAEILAELEKHRPEDAVYAPVQTISQVPGLEPDEVPFDIGPSLEECAPANLNGDIDLQFDILGMGRGIFYGYDDPSDGGHYSFILCMGEPDRTRIQGVYPGHPVYTITEALELGRHTPEDQALIHRMVSGGGRIEVRPETVTNQPKEQTLWG